MYMNEPENQLDLFKVHITFWPWVTPCFKPFSSNSVSPKQGSLGPLVPPSYGRTSSRPCKPRWRCVAVEGISVFMPNVSQAPTLWMLSSVMWCKTWCFARVKCLDSKLLDSARLWWRPRCLNRWVRNCFAETEKWPSRTAAAAFTVFWNIKYYPVHPWKSTIVTQRTCCRRNGR